MLNKTNLKKGIKMFGTIRTVAKVVSVGLTVKSGYDIYKKGKNIYDAYNFTKKTNNLCKYHTYRVIPHVCQIQRPCLG